MNTTAITSTEKESTAAKVPFKFRCINLGHSISDYTRGLLRPDSDEVADARRRGRSMVQQAREELHSAHLARAAQIKRTKATQSEERAALKTKQKAEMRNVKNVSLATILSAKAVLKSTKETAEAFMIHARVNEVPLVKTEVLSKEMAELVNEQLRKWLQPEQTP